MVFCCIAIVGIAIIWFIVLWIRQLFSYPRRDPHHPSRLKAPPRALSGNGARPVYGHTRLFMKMAGDVALLFPADWREVSFLPKSWSRPLGDCFAIFFWGQWRISIRGPKNAKRILNGQQLKQGWPWSPPVTLLGKSCLAMLQEEDEEEAESLVDILQRPLSHRSVLSYAPAFAQAAERCLDKVQDGSFSAKSAEFRRDMSREQSTLSFAVGAGGEGIAIDTNREEVTLCKVKWEALRSYSLDLVNGPLFKMNLWKDPNGISPNLGSAINKKDETQDDGLPTNEKTTDPPRDGAAGDAANQEKLDGGPPSREQMMAWMERLKLGIDVIKVTFGPEWMYVWICNEYGRAVNARMYLEKTFLKHVRKMEAVVPVRRKKGYTFQEPTTQPFPLLTFGRNIYHSSEDIFGDRGLGSAAGSGRPGRARANTLPDLPYGDDEDVLSSSMGSSPASPRTCRCTTADYVTPFETEQDLARPKYRQELVSPMSRSSRRIVRNEKMSPDAKIEYLLSPETADRLRQKSVAQPLETNSAATTSAIQPPVEPMVSPTRLKMIKELAGRDGNTEGLASAPESLDSPNSQSMPGIRESALPQEKPRGESAQQITPEISPGPSKKSSKRAASQTLSQGSRASNGDKSSVNTTSPVSSRYSSGNKPVDPQNCPPLVSPGSPGRRQRSPRTSARKRRTTGSPMRKRAPEPKTLEVSSLESPTLDSPASPSVLKGKKVSIDLPDENGSSDNIRNVSLADLGPPLERTFSPVHRQSSANSPRGKPSIARKSESGTAPNIEAVNSSSSAPFSNTATLSPNALRRTKRRTGSPKKESKKGIQGITEKKPISSLLERLLRQKGPDGKGVSETLMTGLLINLWMTLDAGNAWTAMALHLLSCDHEACMRVQEEIEDLNDQFGSDLFSSAALRQMKFLDALLYESIRLTPPFLGGLKQTTETVELEDSGVQVPKGSHVFFCQPSEKNFDIYGALGQHPENLGKRYPCVELYGFLPLQGLEVPLMVLQSKVFLAITLKRFSPYVSKRRTFIRRVRHTLKEMGASRRGLVTKDRVATVETDGNDSSSVEMSSNDCPLRDLEEGGGLCSEMSPAEAMRLFTKIPFPEPKRVILLRARQEAKDKDSD